MTGTPAKARRCALARCPRPATTTVRACGTVHLCEPCRELVARDVAASRKTADVAEGGVSDGS